ncbi:hypothetical protein PSQ40_19380 [Curvibacter sp. HBC61]|uniref:Agglutinin biogenesis protein MshI n=1 Tax=Curvibacter cyanobacteriorum TaxID=3026422 RepID=A0ABT5N369_9BURK|nr:hypothetical protein [Curvibacter sp. HBC61]MDD0840747.1 hypothetical protein [Curvibacter sp. HBC61]
MALRLVRPFRVARQVAERGVGVCCVAPLGDRVLLLRSDLDAQGLPTTVRHWAVRPVEPGHPESVLAALVREVKKPDQHRWTLLLPPSLCQLGSVELPPLPSDEVKAAVAWRLSEVFGSGSGGDAVNVQNTTFDVLPHPLNRPGADQATYWVWAVANAALQPWLLAFQALKLPPPVVDCTDLAQRNLASRLVADGRAFALLSQGVEGFLLSIVQAGQLYLSRRFEARPIDAERAFGAGATQQLERIALEVQRSLDMFDRKYGQVVVSRLLLAPQAALSAAHDLFRSNLYVPVELLPKEAALTLPVGADDVLCWGGLGALWRDSAWESP